MAQKQYVPPFVFGPIGWPAANIGQAALEPPPMPRTRGEEILQALNPVNWARGVGTGLAETFSGLRDWWTGPPSTQQAEVSGPTVEEILNEYLAGLSRTGSMDMPIGGSAILAAPQVPAPPVFSPPDYSGVEEALAAAYNVTPDEGRGAIRGMYEALSRVGPDAGLADLFFATGIGMGLGRETERDRAEAAQREFQLKLAGLRADQAKAAADTEQMNLRLQYETELERARQIARQLESLKPEVKISGDRAIVTHINPETGQLMVRVMPLSGQPSSGLYGDVKSFVEAGNDPTILVREIATKLYDYGLVPTVIGTDEMQRIQDEIEERIPATMRASGAAGNEAALARMRNEFIVELMKILMENPTALDISVDSLKAF